MFPPVRCLDHLALPLPTPLAKVLRLVFAAQLLVLPLACRANGCAASSPGVASSSSGASPTGGSPTGAPTDGAPSATTGAPSPQDAPLTGFTILKPSADTRTVYVSSSQGDDGNSGKSTKAPLRSVAMAIRRLRDKHPDWLLLRKGDSWTEPLGQWRLSGRSAEEPMVVSSYGPPGERPLLKTGFEGALATTGAGGDAPNSVDHLAIVGLRFYAHWRDPNSPDFAGSENAQGVTWLRGTKDLLIEDNVFQSYTVGIVVHNADQMGITNVRLRRNLMLDSYASPGSHSQGMYADGVDGLLVEGNVFDHNGWNDSPKVSGGKPTIFNHNIYIQTTNRNVTIRDNIILRGSSHGVQLRPGGSAVGNLFVRNPISVLLGGGVDLVPGGVTGLVKDNVILEGTDISATLLRGFGIDMNNVRAATIQDNVIAHVATVGKVPMAIAQDPKANYARNVVYDWGKTDLATSGAFPDPKRSVASYAGTQGAPATFEGFVAAVRAQSRDHWKEQYTARVVNAYIRQGFGR